MPITPQTAVYFKIDPAQLAWAAEFERTLPIALEAASAALLSEGMGAVRRFMHERFQLMNAPRDRTFTGGPIEKSLHGEPFRGMAGLHMEVGRGVVYALQREFGGDISASSKPYLVFQTYDGRWHKVKTVHQEGAHYFGDAVRALVLVAPRAYADAVRRALAAAIATRRAP